jgi:hypothetical protein
MWLLFCCGGLPKFPVLGSDGFLQNRKKFLFCAQIAANN